MAPRAPTGKAVAVPPKRAEVAAPPATTAAPRPEVQAQGATGALPWPSRRLLLLVAVPRGRWHSGSASSPALSCCNLRGQDQ